MKQSRKGIVRRILRYAYPYRRSMILAMVFALLYVVLNLTAPVLIGLAIDKALGQGQVDFDAIWQLLLMTAVTVLARQGNDVLVAGDSLFPGAEVLLP